MEPELGTVQSVARAFHLIEFIARSREEITLSALAEATELPLPTIHRLLRTLVSLGYVRQLPNRRYALGPKLIHVGEVASLQMGAWARPHLAAVVEQLGETANMAILDGDRATYVAQVPSTHSMRMFTEIGRRVHTHSSGVGKALLAFLDEEHVQGIVAQAGLPVATPQTIGTADALARELDLIRGRGYAIDDGEQELGVRCVAVHVPNMPIPTAISVSGPVARIDDGFAERAIPLLRQAASEISAEATHVTLLS